MATPAAVHAAQPDRVIADLRELAALTGGPDGARRVCWTAEWQKAREWERGKLAEIPSCTVEIDEAGNLWATIPGATPDVVVVGSHIDSVPQGGWLDGCLGVLTAVEVLRRYADTTPPVTLRLVDWADEEGARFGRSLLGSTAAAGRLVPDEVRGLKDRDGITLPDALASCGVDLDGMGAANNRLKDIKAYLELHIEQGPVLEQLGLPLGAVQGTFGVERHAIRFEGSTSHAGSTPMNLRRDAFLSAARLALEAREIAKRHSGVATNGAAACEPGIVTAIAGVCTLLIDQRALEAQSLAAIWSEVQEAAVRIAAEEGTTVSWEPLFQIEPIPFNRTLIGFAEQSILEVTDTVHALPSGPLHDAAVMARLFPTTMMFCSSSPGISHSPLEDTPAAHLALAVRAFNGLADRTIAWVAAGQD